MNTKQKVIITSIIITVFLSLSILIIFNFNNNEIALADTITVSNVYYLKNANDPGLFGSLPGGVGIYDYSLDNSIYNLYHQALSINSVSINEGIFTNNKVRIQVYATGTNYNVWYYIFNGNSYDTSTIVFGVRRYYTQNTGARVGALFSIRNSINAEWASQYVNINNQFQIKFIGSNLNINGNNDFQFGRNFGGMFNQGFEIIDNVTNASVYPICLVPNETNSIYIVPDDGYVYPSTIQYTGTASDIQYFDNYGEILITNPTTDFEITGTAQSSGFTINPGIYLLPTLQNLRQISPFTSDFPSQFYFKKYSLTQYLTVGRATDPGMQWSYITMDPDELYGDTLTCTSSNANSGPSLFLFDNGSGKSIALYENILTSQGAYAYNEYIFLVVPQATTASADLEDFISSCIKISDSSNIDKIIDMTDQMFGYILLNYKNDIISTENTYFDMGYAQGFDDGASSNIIEGSVTDIISAIFNGLFGTIFAVEIFPGFPLYVFILIPLVFAILGIILWLIRGR